MSNVLYTIAYANAPLLGAQYATIEQVQEGQQGIYVHFNEAQYGGGSKPFKHCVRTYEDGHLTTAQAIECAKSALQKHAGRSGYYGPMVYTVMEPVSYTATKTDLVTDEVTTLAKGDKDECMSAFNDVVAHGKASDCRQDECAAMLVDGSLCYQVKDAKGNVIAQIFSDESSEPTDRYAAKYGKPEQLTQSQQDQHTNTTEQPQHMALAQGEPYSADAKLVGPFSTEDAMWDYVQANRYSIPRTVAPGKFITVASALASASN